MEIETLDIPKLKRGFPKLFEIIPFEHLKYLADFTRISSEGIVKCRCIDVRSNLRHIEVPQGAFNHHQNRLCTDTD